MELKIGFVEMTEEECGLIDTEKFLLVNFPIKKAIKVQTNYENIKTKEKESLLIEIKKVFSLSKEALSLFEEKEAFEKFVLVTYSLLKKHDIIMIADVGLSYESIDHFRITMKKILEVLENKSLYFVRHNTEKVKINCKAIGKRYY